MIAAISSMATRTLLGELARAFEERTGQAVALESVGGVDAARRVQAGEAFDVVVLARDALDKLAAAGHVVSASVADLARSGVAVAVRVGAPRPDIHGEDTLRAAVRAARTIGYSTGPSGVALAKLFERWGITDELRGRVVTAPPGVPVGALVARGEVELGFQQRSELLHVEGIEVLGGLPPAIDIVTTFSGAVGARAANTEGGRAWLTFLTGPDAAEAKRGQGMEPA